MIGKLKGKVDAVGESFLILDVNGVGYEVQASSRTLRNLKPGDDVALTIDTHVREDAIRLFGFQSEFERTLGRTACVGGFTDADNARLVSQINQLGHTFTSCKADALNNKAATNVSLDFATKAKHE